MKYSRRLKNNFSTNTLSHCWFVKRENLSKDCIRGPCTIWWIIQHVSKTSKISPLLTSIPTKISENPSSAIFSLNELFIKSLKYWIIFTQDKVVISHFLHYIFLILFRSKSFHRNHFLILPMYPRFACSHIVPS